MKLGTVRVDGAERVVVALDDRWAVPLDLGISMEGLILDWATAGPGLSEAAAARRGEALAIADLEWLPPVPRPGKVIGVALNNSANVDRIMSGPKSPATLIKPVASLIGNGHPIRLRPQYGRVHPVP